MMLILKLMALTIVGFVILIGLCVTIVQIIELIRMRRYRKDILKRMVSINEFIRKEGPSRVGLIMLVIVL